MSHQLANKFEHYLPNLRHLAKLEEQRRQEAACNPITLGANQQLKLMMRLGEWCVLFSYFASHLAK